MFRLPSCWCGFQALKYSVQKYAIVSCLKDCGIFADLSLLILDYTPVDNLDDLSNREYCERCYLVGKHSNGKSSISSLLHIAFGSHPLLDVQQKPPGIPSAHRRKKLQPWKCKGNRRTRSRRTKCKAKRRRYKGGLCFKRNTNFHS